MPQLTVFSEGTIKMFSKSDRWIDFDDKAKGREPRYTYFIQTSVEDKPSEIVKVNSKSDFSKYVDQDAVLTFTLYPTSAEKGGTAYYMSLTDVKLAKE